MHNRISRRALACALYASTALISSAPALAQAANPPPVRQSVDSNGVDLFLGTFNVRGPVLSLGRSGNSLEYYQVHTGSGFGDNLYAQLNVNGSTQTVWLGGKADGFTGSGGVYTNTEGNGSTLSLSGSLWTYTRADGTRVTFDSSKDNRATTMIAPNGATLTYNYAGLLYCTASKPGRTGDICLTHATDYHLGSVSSSFGYRISFRYDNYDPGLYDPNDVTMGPAGAGWNDITGVGADNLAVATSTVRSESFADGAGTHDITDAMGRVTHFRVSGLNILGVTLPGDSSESITIGYTSGRVTSVTTPSGTTTYSSSDLSGVRTVTVTDPLSHTTTYKFDIALQRMTSVTDANSHTTAAQYDGNGRVTRVTQPEGNYTQLTYDGRGNVTERREVAKSGSGVADIVLSAGFDATCANVVKCNQPNWTKDAKGNQTDYSYDPTHGGVLTVTLPAAASGGIRPQTRYGYTALQAYYKNGSGSIVASGQPVYELTSVSQCQTGASCAGTADEVKSTIAYGPQTIGTGNNLLPVSTSAGSGDGLLTATVASGYDDVGNLLTVDGPLAGTGDTTAYRYNADRELVGAIGPDPDGAGPLKNRAKRVTIDSRGLTTRVENGTTAGQTDTAWSAFVPAEYVDLTYDGSHRLIAQRLSSAGTAYALSQTSYLPDDRVNCVAIRMNPAAFGSPPAPCSLGTQGSDGPDRITQNFYDAAGQLQLARVAVGTSDQADERTLAYTNNGKLAALTDGENNKTAYVYDGFDRLAQTQYPSATKGAGTSNAGDYEQLSYDVNSNIISRRLRDGNAIGFAYDALNRVTLKDVPGTTGDVNYTYDLLGRSLTATFATGGLGITNTFDALGRLATSASNMDGTNRTLTSQYDAAGNRTALLGNVNNYTTTFSYDTLGRMTSYDGWARIGYDDLGRRSSMSMGNPGTTSSVAYGYDPAGRLASLTHDLAGTAADHTLTFGYNPASQIATRTGTNDSYAYTGIASGTTGYISNGLNQYAAAGAASPTYDQNGNLTFDGSNNYVYDAENRLVSVSGAHNASLSYDPLGRLWQVSSSSGTTRFVYDGDHDVIELDGAGNGLRAFVFGPGADEPLVSWWESGNPRMLHADERGSIVSVADSAGNVIATNSYDEYGTPGAANQGRFQYTGQMWLPEVGVYYYKARMYSPTHGRFLQTDPIGYGDGPNWYNYVGSDPVNGADPQGTSDSAPKQPPCTGSILPECPGSAHVYYVGSFDNENFYPNANGELVYSDPSGDASSLIGQGSCAGSGVSYACSLFTPASATSQDSNSTVYIPSALYQTYQEGFLRGNFIGSALSQDPWHTLARNPIVLQYAVREGTMFYIDSRTYFLRPVLLQAPIGFGRNQGVVEYIMPQDWNFFLGTPEITHARFVPGAGVSGWPNNDWGRVAPPIAPDAI